MLKMSILISSFTSHPNTIMPKFSLFVVIAFVLNVNLHSQNAYDFQMYIHSCCGVSIADSIHTISLYSHDLDSTYYTTYNQNQNAYFYEIPQGVYDLTVNVSGYKIYEVHDYTHFQDSNWWIDIFPPAYPPSNIQFDTVASVLTWDMPVFAPLQHAFDFVQFPPSGWAAHTEGVGWIQTANGGSEGFLVPDNGGKYAVVNNDTAPDGNNGCCDKLITREVNLRYRNNHIMHFDSYFTGANGQTATVFYSIDKGESWEILFELQADSSWTEIEIDLTFLSGFYGEDNVRFQFHASDNGMQGSGWAIDNFIIEAGEFYPEYYFFYIDPIVSDSIPADEEFSYFVPDVVYGQKYFAQFGAVACCNVGSKYISFTSGYLSTPKYFQSAFVESTGHILLHWTVPELQDSVAPGLESFSIFMDGELTQVLEYEEQGLSDTINYFVQGPLGEGEYEFCLISNYDLSYYGFEGEYGNSLSVCDTVVVQTVAIAERSIEKSLIDVYPNPFHNSVTIGYHLNQPCDIMLTIFNHLGEQVEHIRQHQKSGRQSVKWEPHELPSGMYYFRLQAKDQVSTGKMILK